MKSIKRIGILVIISMLLGAGCATPGGDVFGDYGITTRVKTAIFSEPGLKSLSIHVSTEGRMVTLSGSVKTAAEKAKAIHVARNVEGVKGVRSELVVE